MFPLLYENTHSQVSAIEQPSRTTRLLALVVLVYLPHLLWIFFLVQYGVDWLLSRVCSIVKNRPFGPQGPPLAARAHKKTLRRPERPRKTAYQPHKRHELHKYSK